MAANPTPSRPEPQSDLFLKGKHADCFSSPASHDAQVNIERSPTPTFEATIGPQVVTVTDSGAVHTINLKNCQASIGGSKQVVATLFYTGGNATEEVAQYGHFISQTALFDFISYMRQIGGSVAKMGFFPSVSGNVRASQGC